MLSKVGEATVVDDCVHGLVTEIFNPLGVAVAQVNDVDRFLDGTLLKETSTPFVGCVARFPLPIEHVSLITAMSGDALQETSFGTGSGKVRSATFPSEYFMSFWAPQYDGANTAGDLSGTQDNYTGTNATATTSILNLGTQAAANAVANALIPAVFKTRSFWIRAGFFALGATILTIAGVKLFSDTGAGQAVNRTVKQAAEVAAVVPK